MKKLLFMCINMNIGGTEKALLNMMDIIPQNKYKVTLLMLEEYGGFLDQVPEWIEIKYLEGFKKIKNTLNEPPIKVISKNIKNKKIKEAINISIVHLLSKIKGERSLYFRYVLREYKEYTEKYDIAVAYAGPMDFITYFILNKVMADRKVQWIHFDVTKIAFNTKFANKFYSKFDNVLVVSREGKQQLENLVPKLKGKIQVKYNEISSKKIKELADKDEGFNDGFDGIRILTVGRLTKEKGQDITIPILAKLIENKYNIKWYCIGDGNCRKEYEEVIKKFNIQDSYMLLGSKANPYPYISQCDIYVQPSIHEGYCITLAEAKCFNKNIICTNFTGAKEQLTDSEKHIIIDRNEDEIYQSIVNVIENSLFNKYKFSRTS